jgi:hypothetical protein
MFRQQEGFIALLLTDLLARVKVLSSSAQCALDAEDDSFWYRLISNIFKLRRLRGD